MLGSKSWIIMGASVLFIYLTAIAACSGQLHPDDETIDCFHCDDTTRDNFPLCLEHPVKCAPNEVCQVRYGWGTDRHIPHIKCRSLTSCQAEVNNHPTECPNGGFYVLPDICEECVDTNKRVADLTRLLRLELVSSQHLFCPGRCHLDDMKTCIDTGRVCHHIQFCQIQIDHADRISGDCQTDLNYDRCQRIEQSHNCPVDFKNTTAYDSTNRAHCIVDCCTNNECLFPYFGIHMANAALPPTSQPPAGAEGGTLWEQLRGSCQDVFDKVHCQSLKNDHGVCDSRLALSMCPYTCGICSAVGNTVCKDTTDVCPGMVQANPDYCKDAQAVFECPVTCNLCNNLIDSVITSVIDGSYTEPGVTITATSTPSPVDCNTISVSDCAHVAPLCDTTFLGVVCPLQCETCKRGGVEA